MARLLFWKPKIEDEVSDELAFHLEMRVRELVERGMAPEAARAEALRRFGNLAGVADACRSEGARRDRTMRRAEWLAELRQDMVYGCRTLVRNPGFTALALLTLGIGIGATTAIFSAVNAVILRPLDLPAVHRVMLISEEWHGLRSNVSVGNYIDWAAANAVRPVFSALGTINWGNYTLTGGDRPERVLGARANATYFQVMQVAPQVGRVFSEDEDRPGGPPVVVLSHRLWARRFGSDPAALRRTLSLNGQPYAIIGVMPSGFDFTTDTEELWLPAAFTPEQRAQHDEHYLTVYGRLRSDATRETADAMLRPVMKLLAERYPDANGKNTILIEPMMAQFVGDARQQLLLILGAVAMVMLIACANVANLLLARGAARAREFAIRASIGAGRSRLLRQLLAESGVLAIAAAIVGVGVAGLVIRTLVAAAPPGVPRLEQARLDPATLAFSLLIALLSVMVFGLAPALRIAAADLQSTLRTGQSRGGGTQRDWLRQGLVTAEVALALVLLVAATLLVRTAIHLQRLDPGFEPRGVVTARLSLPAEGYASPESVRRAFETVLANLTGSPGVGRAALVTQVPMGPGGSDNGLVPEGKPLSAESSVGARFRLVSPGYFAAMGIAVRRGRGFTLDDRAGAPRAMVVNETLARALFPGQDPIGKRVACCEGERNDPRWKTIVGVVGDVRSQGPDQAVPTEFFLPMAQSPDQAWTWIGRTMNLVARGRGDPLALTPALREAVRRMDPGLPLYRIGTMESLLSGSLVPARFRTALLGALAGIGLLLAMVGIYGVVAFLVTRRRSEIGVRMALGASPRDVLRLVVGQGLRPVLVGIVLGGIAAFITTRFLASWLHGVTPTDPATFAGVALALVVVAVVASLIPARRATRVQAVEAMRAD